MLRHTNTFWIWLWRTYFMKSKTYFSQTLRQPTFHKICSIRFCQNIKLLRHTPAFSAAHSLGNTALAQSASELWLDEFFSKMANHTFHESFLFLSKIGFLSHSFVSRYDRKPIKNSKDADFSPVSKKRWAKNGSLGWRPRPGKLGQNGQNMSPLWRQPQKTQNEQFCFQSQAEDLPNP